MLSHVAACFLLAQMLQCSWGAAYCVQHASPIGPCCCCCRPLVPQAFECEVGWWGNKQLNGFRQLESAAMRIRACQRARRQGSLHLPLWRRLAQLAAAGRLTVLEGWEVAEASPLAQADEEASAADWQLSLTQRDAGSHQPTLFQQAVAATSGGSSPQQAQPEGQRQRQLRAQLVWLACGRAYNAAADPVLQQLQQQRPTLLAGGYPRLDDEHLCWPGAAVYVMGRGSLLSVGPCAGGEPSLLPPCGHCCPHTAGLKQAAIRQQLPPGVCVCLPFPSMQCR